MYRLLLLVIVLFTYAVAAAQNFNFTEGCKAAYRELTALHIKEGERFLEKEAATDADNLIPLFLQNYADFFYVYTNDTRAAFEERKKNKDLRLAQLNLGNVASPYYLYTQAEVHIQWAALNIRFGEYLAAIQDIRKAYKYLEQNERRYPDFKANRKTLGLLYALIGSVPDKYKWAVTMLGMSGEVKTGLRMLQELCSKESEQQFLFYRETVIIYSFLLSNLQADKTGAWEILKKNGFPARHNVLELYTVAYMGVYGGNNDAALQLLSDKTTTEDFAVYPFLYYLKGLARLQSGDTDAAENFKQFIASYKGDNHLKSAFQKIAWCYLVKNDTLNYYHFISKAGNLGSDMIDADKQAEREAESSSMPDVTLLKVRLLFDGGYYTRALQELKRVSVSTYTTPELKTEYYYRQARIYAMLNQEEEALKLYAQVIETGKQLPRYFAANAAYESGKILEKKKDNQRAKEFYTLCLSFDNHEYKNGLDQKAKAALQQLNQ